MNLKELMTREESSDSLIKEARKAALRQTASCLPEFSEDFKSIYSVRNFYEKADNIYWTNGFWTGELWLTYEETKDEKYKDAAVSQVKSFKKVRSLE